jgi:pyruvate dehydrogenase E2 component (dihydrolipoamide acetyltransferase)
MPIKILMPALSPTMTEGTLAKWIKQEGDSVAAGDVMAEIETDKATMEVEAVDEGIIGRILVQGGTANVAVNDAIAVLLEEGESVDDIDSFLANDTSVKSVETPAEDKPSKVETVQAINKPTRKTHNNPQPSNNSRVFASPLAKRIANDKGLDLSTVKGSGPHGRIIKIDVEHANPKAAAQKSQTSGPDARQLADMLGMSYETKPNSSMRSVIASRLQESKQVVPHFYLTVECRIDALLDARKKINAEAEGKFKLSVNDFVLKASAMALKTVPQANASWTDEAILYYDNADISVAVATPDGLITPIIKEAEHKSLPTISVEMKELAKKARDGKLKPHEYQGGTFSVSNLGMFGVSEFSAIINPPQACIIAVGAGLEKPMVKDGQIEIGTAMNVTLSCDHRVVDGAVGAQFLQAFQNYIENPVLLFV